jgi:phage shock protein A
MRGSSVGLLLILTVAAASARAATGLEITRKEATAARGRVNEIRAQQMSLRSELNQLATRIEALKAESKGALLKAGPLESSLRRSQELSGLLTDAAQRLAHAEAELERHDLALLSTLSAELEAMRARWDRTSDRQARAELLRRMREIRAEREQVRARLPAARVPALEVRGSDDPEDLLEQADALRDSEDKVRQQMRALQAQIAEIRRERELERRMSDFLGEEKLFDEQDRRLRSATSSSRLRAAGDPAPGGSTAFSFGTTDAARETAPTSASPTPSGTSTPAPIPDSRPFIGGGNPPALDGADVRELSALEAKLKKLESLAQQLDERADAIEARARGLR